MKNNGRSSRVALAAAVVAVMAMSAMSAEAAVRRMPADGPQLEVGRSKQVSARSSLLRRQAVSDWMIRFWEPLGELPIMRIARGGSQK